MGQSNGTLFFHEFFSKRFDLLVEFLLKNPSLLLFFSQLQSKSVIVIYEFLHLLTLMR